MANVTTPEFRVSYPNLFKPRLNDLNGKEEFSMTALFKKGEDLTLLKKLIHDTAAKAWGADKAKWPANLRMPLRDQGEKKTKEGKTPEGYEAGAAFVNLKTQKRPSVVDQNVQALLDEGAVYSGCWCRASVSAYAYDQKGNRGVSLSLMHVQLVRDGDPLSGRPKVTDAFTPIDGGGENIFE